MAAIFLGNIRAAILDFQGHQVQSGPLELSGYDFGITVQKLRHCAPNINEMPAFSVQHVKHKNLLKMTKFTKIVLEWC